MMNVPLLSPQLLQRPAMFGGARDWSWHEVHAAAAELATRLQPKTPICNLCATRVGFLITFLAALRQGCLQRLPPSGGSADLGALLADGQRTTVVVDDETLLRGVTPAQAGGLVYLPQAPVHLPPAAALAFTPDPDQPAVCLYTSGTTGTPRPQFKTLRQLVHGARALAARLDSEVEGGLDGLRAVVCSVPPQHMFGFETSVMLPLVTGIAVLERRPLLPSDVHAALAHCGGPAAWIATPLHLRALASAAQALTDCRFALVSTMPLAAGLAAQVEQLVQAPVIEILGSTETGVMATRRTARDTLWQAVGDVRLERSEAGTRAWGAHFPSPQEIPDLIELSQDGRFELLGRHADMVKIGGRRASLAGLNLLLQDLPGLSDGVFYLPRSDAAADRLVLLHTGALDRVAAERWLRGRMDPTFLPRAFIAVAQLPRDANGKLPGAALDALYALHSAQRARAPGGPDASIEFEFRIPAGHPALAGHFPGHPVVPGVLILDQVIDRLRQHTGLEVTRLPRVKFTAPLQPEETACVQLRLRGASASFRVSVARGEAHKLIAEGGVQLGQALTEAAP